jgi:Protein chain release factor B
MLLDDLKEKLKQIAPDIETIKTFWSNSNNEAEFQELLEKSNQEDFWKNPQQTEILKSLQKIRTQRDSYLEVIKNHEELLELIELFHNDENELQKLSEDVTRHCRQVARFKVALLLQDEQDNANCFLNINSGAGGTESQDWAEMLLRMYLRFCEREKYTIAILDYQSGEEAGIKSATVFIKGKMHTAY